MTQSASPLATQAPAGKSPPEVPGDPAREGVSIIIPAYNEENGAAPVLRELLDTLARDMDPAIPVEVLVVDDGSSDNTAAAIQPFEGDVLRLIRHPQNRGYGASIKTGLTHARYPWFLITDADGTYPNRYIPELLRHRDVHQMVVGARTGANAQIPMLRRPPKWVLRKLASYLSRTEIPDLNSGLRVVRADIARKFENLLPDRFSYTTTITLAMISAGYHVKYMPIDYLKREGKSKIRPIADTLAFLKLVIRTVMYFDPLRVFLPVALIFMLIGVAVAVSSYSIMGTVMDVTTVILVVTGFHMLALGMLADMLNLNRRAQ